MGACAFSQIEVSNSGKIIESGNNAVNTIIESNTNVSSSNGKNTFNIQNKDAFRTNPNNPFRIKPRRKNIKFPDDCSYISIGSDNWQLIGTCADALKDILPELPDDNCQYGSVKKDGSKFFMVVDDTQLLTYRLQEPLNFEDIENLAQKLNTTSSNIIFNNKFNEGGKLTAGQEIKYQKSHLEKSSSSNWFDDYNIEFYPLFSNRYLVKVRCDAGAYNELNAYLLYDESALPAKAKVLEFPSFNFEYPDDENSDTPKAVKNVTVKTVGGRYFNPETKELIVFVKAHGIGDAGCYARYSFPNGKPKLEEFRAKFKWEGHGYGTDEILKSPPKTWKRYYPK